MSNRVSINTPKMTKELAEFLGICFGDGHLALDDKRNDYRLDIVGHAEDDKEYLRKHVCNLLIKLFAVNPKFLESRHTRTLVLYIRSKDLIFFINGLGMPIGKKMELIIPNEIKGSKSFMGAFIRGLFDTDGTLTFKKRYRKIKYYPSVSISSTSRNMLEDIRLFLIDQGFRIGKIIELQHTINGRNRIYTIYKLFIYGNEMIGKWFSVIGSHNPKALNRYSIWLRNGHVK